MILFPLFQSQIQGQFNETVENEALCISASTPRPQKRAKTTQADGTELIASLIMLFIQVPMEGRIGVGLDELYEPLDLFFAFY
jgi:hypothetical protein